MENVGLRKMVWMMVVGLKLAKSELHYVGGSKKGWAPNANLSEWSSHQHFSMGDWLCECSFLLFFLFLFILFLHYVCLVAQKVRGKETVR